MRIKSSTGKVEPLWQKPGTFTRQFGIGRQIRRFGDE
jgi:hypothetical protein